jgi:hypothetical protein
MPPLYILESYHPLYNVKMVICTQVVRVISPFDIAHESMCSNIIRYTRAGVITAS